MPRVTSGELARPNGAVVQAVYLVFIHVSPANEGDPNVELVGAKLTAGAAEKVSRAYPGSWTEKVQAGK